jgi:release factor glutamine methyltransferase
LPTPKGQLGESIPGEAGPPWAYNAGEDGRRVLDPLCHAAPDLLTPGGTFLVVHSEFSGIGETLRALRMRGLTAQIVASQRIPFGTHGTGAVAAGHRPGDTRPAARAPRGDPHRSVIVRRRRTATGAPTRRA